jgi:hypothetical protein
MSNATTPTSDRMPPATLIAQNTANGWCVVDADGGVWWPDTTAERVIERAPNPGQLARVLCHTEPTRGTWVY